MPISKRSQKISPFIVMDVLDKAKEMEKRGDDIIHLEVGEPDFNTPEVIKKVAIEALERGETHYTHSLGIIELRETIAEHYYNKYGVSVDPSRVIVTCGTSPAMLLIFGALINPEERVILSNPYYPCYPNFIRFVGGEPIFVNIYEEDGFQYKIEKIKEKLTEETKAIIVNSPANPTGNLLEKEVLSKVAELGPFVISDEIYHGLVYKGKEHTILEFTDRAFVLNGFSKLYAMTGWRLGYVVAPPEFVRPMQKLQQNIFISASAFVQWAGIAALKKAFEDVEIMVSTFNKRRVYIIDELRRLGFGIKVPPTGAFYVLANAKRFTTDSHKFAFSILEKARVAVTPGIDFGSNAEGYLRFSYSNSIENIKEGMMRLHTYLDSMEV